MKIQLNDILAVEDQLDYAEPVEALNATLAGGSHDYEFSAPLYVHVGYSRSQLDLFSPARCVGRPGDLRAMPDRFPSTWRRSSHWS
jgi:hypothetical protein